MSQELVYFTESQGERRRIMNELEYLAIFLGQIDLPANDGKSIMAKQEAIFRLFRIVTLLTSNTELASKILDTAKLPPIEHMLDRILADIRNLDDQPDQ